ncbi:MAG: PAS-domain containing protein [Alphaproteobacteria bacterium]|nr:PAS-domain containing protein [Alphaproteobacteria bacterium]
MTTGQGRGWLGRTAIILSALVLVALTWFGTLIAVDAERSEARAHVEAEVSNQALVFEDQLAREFLVLDQTLRILEHEWESDPHGFDLQGWRQRTLVLRDISLHLFIADANGIIRASTRPELLGVDVSGRDYFRAEAALPHDDGRMFIGPSTRGLVTNRWQMNMARRLDGPNGRFLGVLGLSYDTGSLTRFYRQVDLGDQGMIALVGTGDGKLRALVGPVAAEPGLDISKTQMFAALRADPNGHWVGPSPLDGVQRFHAFHAVPDRDLAVVVAFDAQTALHPSRAFARGAHVFAGGTTLFILVMAGGLVRELGMARRREDGLNRDRATLAAANAELDAARRRADAKAAQLEATLGGMSDGVSMLDPDLRLVAWNRLFAEFTGVPADLLRVGMPMEEIIRTQAKLGEFGPVDVEKEVARRMAVLRSGPQTGTLETPRPGGRTLELRRSALPGGGFVTLYADITARKQAEETMRRAREMAEATTEAKSHFVATVSHEIRTPLNTLLNSLRLLTDTGVSDSQRRLVDMARQAGDSLLGLINDILEMSKMEAGRLTLRPSLFALRPLLDGVLDLFHDQAVGRGMSLSLMLAPGVPDLVHGDSGRIRQVLINLLSNAVKFADPGPIVLLAEMRSESGRSLLRLTVRDPGPALSSSDRSRLFQPFSRLDRPQGNAAPGTGLGLVICQSLAALMNAEIGWDEAPLPGGGNDFWIALPVGPAKTDAASSRAPASPVTLRRTRILLVEDILPNQLVTAMMLRREGHMVDVAESGEAALRMLSAVPYDVVLMDVFMPGMTGLEATKRIRALGGPAGVVPVIALTANTAAEDRERCLRAGMNDMVAKPVELARLLDVIRRHVWPSHPLPQRKLAAPEEAEAAPLEPVLAAERIAELRANLTQATVADLAEDCLAELRDRLPGLRDAMASGDAQEIEAHAHAMAGLAASYGMAALDQRLRAVIDAGRGGLPLRAEVVGDELAAELARAAPVLRAALRAELVVL